MQQPRLNTAQSVNIGRSPLEQPPNSCADEHSESEPPDPFPNSEVKPLSADGSVELSM